MEIIELCKIKDIIKSGSLIAIGGFTINRKPMSVIKEICKSQISKLHLYFLAGSIDADMLIKESKVSKISAAYVGYEGLGLSHITRKAVESGEVLFEDLTEILYYYSLKVGAEKLPYLMTDSIKNTDIMNVNSGCERIINGENDVRCKINAINPDYCIIHAQKADKEGNIMISEPDFCEKEMARASKITIFSVEKIGKIEPEEITIPKKHVNYIVVSKRGALPTGCKDHYLPDIKQIVGNLENE
ncbi:hypothetical protein HY212_06885 [Candidatus Pacearchaeota archaeon]|nr:hypothetical protein [Candidatus Pacearchaeota archaeon]